MNTIAVLTDFSERSVHATRFAMHMAKKMRAKVLLFSISTVPANRQLMTAGEPSYLPDPVNELADFTFRMGLELQNRSFPGACLPGLAFHEEGPEIVDIMTAIMENNEINMIVTFPSGSDDLATYVLGDTCNRIIDWATVPVLVVPECAAVRNFEKIAFASQLHGEDLHSIAELGGLMENFAAELMVAHLNEDPSDIGIQAAEKQLSRDLYQKLDCGGFYFRSIPDTSVQKDWSWLNANKKTDLLAVVQQPREQMARFFKRGRHSQVTYHITIPVIILPQRP
ncbi:Nucleotide-binding universal stress protein, UspA family [Mucilaginibacter sp. OK268]|uniref:universal stress protein n=1 Tax=Mucilaginibacter sp. OK268 TaxID=1881048 RepID=UPI00088FD720|nr:universal stress protein [Mucilaginibacter sp. OK268]SDP97009.1 Nucleotide-binding universal stress protein, UspA family [Mucilaginibacter sp. OK268]